MARPASRALARLGVMLALVLPLSVACGEATKATPSPAAIETAVSTSRPVVIDALDSETPEAGGAGGTVELHGHVFGHGPTGVILAHMRPADQTAWFPYAAQLGATGKYTVLTFDFRGFGESQGDKDFHVVDLDLTSAYDYIRDALGIAKVFLVGASMGGTASLVLGTRVPVAGVVSVSSPAQFPPLDAVAAIPDLRVPKLFIVSKDDKPQARDQATMVAEAPAPVDEVVYEGSAHGTDLLAGPNAAAVKQRITAFLAAH
jgi:pimeloyl-ACP methyl ester carboxylesterase